MDVIWGPKCPTAHTHPGWGQLVVISSVCTGVRLGGHSRSPAQGGLRGDNAISTGWGDRLGPLPSAQAVPHLQGTWLGAARDEARRAEGALSVGGRTLWNERGEQSRMRVWGAEGGERCQSWHFPPPPFNIHTMFLVTETRRVKPVLEEPEGGGEEGSATAPPQSAAG